MDPGAKCGVTVREDLGLVESKREKRNLYQRLSEVSHPGVGRGCSRTARRRQDSFLWCRFLEPQY